MNIDCDKIKENLDNSENEYISYFQKFMILQFIKNIFCEILIGGRNIFYTDQSFKVTNIRKYMQNDSSEFEGLLHKMVTKKPFVNQDISYINGNDESK